MWLGVALLGNILGALTAIKQKTETEQQWSISLISVPETETESNPGVFCSSSRSVQCKTQYAFDVWYTLNIMSVISTGSLDLVHR
jgi:hypothetical protein